MKAQLSTKLLSFCGLILFFWIFSAQAKPLILSSIKPLTLISQEIAGQNADVDTLLPITASPHDYPLKASDYSRLQKADVVLWVGPELESFLQKPLHNLAQNRVISAYQLNGLYWPEDHSDESEHHHERDPHLWLDPRNAIVIARAINEKLAQIDPANKTTYAINLQLFVSKINSLDDKLTLQLKPLADLGFVVYHEGYRHFVSHFGLHQLDYVTFTPEQHPGAKHLHQLRETLKKEGGCLFLEPYNELQSARDLAKDLHLPIGLLDALGDQHVVNYTQLLEQMANAFSHCLMDRRSKRNL